MGTYAAWQVNEVWQAIAGERRYQDQRWPGHLHSVDEWLVFLMDYLTEAAHIVSHTDTGVEALPAVRKIAAMCVACREQSREQSGDPIEWIRYQPAAVGGERPGMSVTAFVALMIGVVGRALLRLDTGDAAITLTLTIAVRCMLAHGAPPRQDRPEGVQHS